MNITNVYDAYRFLKSHPVFNGWFQIGLDVDVVKTNPDTRCIDDDFSKNTFTQVWLECSVYDSDLDASFPLAHDYELDCGGDSFEDALVKLAELVLEKYGDYR